MKSKSSAARGRKASASPLACGLVMAMEGKPSQGGREPRGMRERYAIRVMSEATRKPESYFQIARTITPGLYYDWVDPETGEHGQCRLNDNGTWHTKPKGQRPVVVLYVPPPSQPPSQLQAPASAAAVVDAAAQSLLQRWQATRLKAGGS